MNNSIAVASQQRFRDHARAIHKNTDRLFAALLVIQWLGGILIAFWLTPNTWTGRFSSVHPHVFMAIIGGGLLTAMPVSLAIHRPGALVTRMSVAMSQVLFSSLLIHLTGGRIETHFHVFGSLAFLAAYRDWRVLVPATVIVAIDHLVRGIWWPESVFGVVTASNWRWLEHTAWVLFEDIFLLLSIRQSISEMKKLATYTTCLEVALKEAEASEGRANSANEAKSRFLANMSHEMRTPLNGILGFTELLLDKDRQLTVEERTAYAGTIQNSGRHLTTLIDDILDLAKIESGRLLIEVVPCSPHKIISETCRMLSPNASGKGLTLRYNWRGPVPTAISTDPGRLRQLLVNVVGNAVRFTEQGQVLVTAWIQQTQDDSQLVIEVQDTGIGIAADKIDAVFEPFVQADDSTSRKFGGTGLGLAISRRIAAALNGQIELSSKAGFGTTCMIRIAAGDLTSVEFLSPEQLCAKPEPAEKRSPSNAGRLSGVRALVVDDVEVNRRLLALMLTKSGAHVETAENGRVAVDLILQSKYDIIFMDMQMPVLDGYSATRELRSGGHTLPIIAVTANAMAGDREKCLAAGCSDYIAKPVTDVELLNTTTKNLCATVPQGRA